MKIIFGQKPIGAIAIVSLLAACSTPKEASLAADSTVLDPTTSEVEQVVNTETASSKSFESAYTDLNLENCEVLEELEESSGQRLLCEGYEGIPLYVTEIDGRFDVDAGARNTEWITRQRPFSSVGDKVEWRLHNSKPIAAILRFNFTTGENDSERTSELAVLSVGTEELSGCLVDWVSADAQPSQNEAARRIADQRANNFDCNAQTATTAQLPASMLGRFDRTPEDCTRPGTMTRLTLTSNRFDFYYGYADVNAITAQLGGYNVDATLFLLEGVPEVRPNPIEYRIEPAEQGNDIQFGTTAEEWLPMSSFVRCDES